MSKNLDLANEHTSQGKDPDRNAPIRHCIILTLIGLAAIAISIALPPDEKAPAVSAMHTAPPASTLVPPAVEPTATPFDPFPAQVPAPQSDPQELPSTY